LDWGGNVSRALRKSAWGVRLDTIYYKIEVRRILKQD